MTEEVTKQAENKPAEEPTLNLALKLSSVNGILAALGKLPFEQVNGLVQEIVRQANEQLSTTQA